MDRFKDTSTHTNADVFETAAIKGGGWPTRLLPHAKMLLIPIRLFLSAG